MKPKLSLRTRTDGLHHAVVSTTVAVSSTMLLWLPSSSSVFGADFAGAVPVVQVGALGQQGGGSAPAPVPGNEVKLSLEEVPNPADQDTAGTVILDRPTYHSINLSGDYFFGKGRVTMPLNYSLSQTLNLVPAGPGQERLGLQEQVDSPARSANYWGATLAYSNERARHWSVEFSYRQGSSSGGTDLPLGSPGAPLSVPAQFSIDDQWYQGFIRYSFKPYEIWQPYVKAGVTYVTADLAVQGRDSVGSLYQQTDETKDWLGGVGVGILWRVKSQGRVQIGLQLEGEGFYGGRRQESVETLTAAEPFSQWATARINNTVYGGVGRGTVKVDVNLAGERLWLYANAGAQVYYTIVEYPQAGGGFDELLWGPYVKLGLNYRF